MKNLSEKFDQLPQDFDREAIWKGVEKPVLQPVLHRYSWGGLSLIASAALFVVLLFDNSPVSKPETTDTVIEASLQEEATVVLSGPEAPGPGFESGAQRDVIFSETTNHPGEIRETEQNPLYGIGSNTKSQEGILSPGGQEHDKKVGKAEALPALLLPLKSSQENVFPLHEGKILVRQKGARHRLAVQAGIGTHRLDFLSSGVEGPAWRSNLEKPQLDFGLGIRYEYALRHNFLLSFSAAYRLYKDQITTAHIRESIYRAVQIDYDLHNHYHVFSGQVEMGKRFFQKAFFWDISGGLGLKFNQITDVDFFVGAGELAGEEQVKSTYQRPTDVFLTAQAALGRQLSDRLFVRMGTQVHSAIELTAPQAQIRHRLVPIHVFLEAGIRF